MVTSEERRQAIKEFLDILHKRYVDNSDYFGVEHLTQLMIKDIEYVMDKYHLSPNERAALVHTYNEKRFDNLFEE